ncbi:hypothetical protein PsorP6_001008 [Peronosclerospora sorghi]|uniref:Uncharacterized protein n=1 Tax=Peronosclerospora sorghi TaxID=230839 RepID=A0ACC0WTR5_9STRA|nr:hypothetical protein PsorP6_001008 [Peronosclerospora sorghi]
MPIDIVAITEQDVSEQVAEQFSGLYYAADLCAMVAEALYECLLCALVPAPNLDEPVDSTRNDFSRDLCGALAYCCLMSTRLEHGHAITALAFIMSITSGISSYVIAVSFPSSVADTACPHIFGLPEFYIAFFLALLLCFGRNILWKAYKREMKPEYYHILQEYQNVENRILKEPTGHHLICATFQSSRAANITNHRPSEADLKVYTGFAFSTQVLEVRFLNPLREFALPVSQVANATSRVLPPNGTPLAVRIVKAHCVMKLRMTRDPLKTRSWSFPLRTSRRFQVFTGWGYLRPGLLLITDPPRFTDAAMTDDAGPFDLDHWVVDPGLGGFDQWQYATRFKDFTCAQHQLQQKHRIAHVKATYTRQWS